MANFANFLENISKHFTKIADFLKHIFWEHVEFGTVQKCANLVELEKC